MPKNCSVFGCNSYYKLNTEISFHKFPLKNKQICIQWKAFCQRKSTWEPNLNTVICSKHFEDSDFELNFKQQLMNMRTKRILKPNVIPKFLKPNSCAKYESQIDPLCDLEIKKENISDEEDIEYLYDEQKYISELNALKQQVKTLKLEVETKNNDVVALKLQLEKHETEILNEKAKYKVLFNSVTDLRNDIKTLITNLKSLEREKKKILQTHILKSDFYIELKKRLAPSLTKNQCDIILNKKQKVRWTKMELIKAYTLRYFVGKRGYLYVKNELHIPLPHISTLQKYANRMKFNDPQTLNDHNYSNTLAKYRNLIRRKYLTKKKFLDRFKSSTH